LKENIEGSRMSRIETIPVDQPFIDTLLSGLAYPLRGAALATCLVLTVLHYADLIPFAGALISIALWTATWRYAADCLLHSSHGYFQPPDVVIQVNTAQGWWLSLIHVLGFVFCIACAILWPHAFPLLLLLVILVLPAIDMSMALDGHAWMALNPVHWIAIIGKFGAAYLIPVIINAILSGLMYVSMRWSAQLPNLLAQPVACFLVTYLIVLGFHLMGVMVYQRHEQFGLIPESQELIAANGQNDDQLLLARVAAMEASNPDTAIALLVERMQGRHAPAEFHQTYQRLLRKQGHREALLEHGHIWIAALMADGEPRRALGVLQGCSEDDPDFMPDDPSTVHQLADLASRLGMSRLALRLCNGYLARWPRAQDAVSCGLLAVRLLSGPLDRPAEAQVLLAKLMAMYSEHPQHSDMHILQLKLQSSPGTP
jgi:hypothetical protein